MHSEYALLLANVIVAGEGATFHDVPHFAGGIVPGDGIFTSWSSRAGAGRAEAFLLNPLRSSHLSRRGGTSSVPTSLRDSVARAGPYPFHFERIGGSDSERKWCTTG